MNKTPVPKWPLYIADAAVLAASIAVAYPNVVLMETMSAGTAAFCFLLSLCAMAMVLTPYVLEHIQKRTELSQNAKETRKNIDLIFENLSALQLMEAETREMGDKIEEKLAFQLAKDTDIKFAQFQKSLENALEKLKAAEAPETLDAKIDAKFEQFQNSLDELCEVFREKQKAADAKIAELAANLDAMQSESDKGDDELITKQLAEQILEEFSDLKNQVADIDQRLEDAQAAVAEEQAEASDAYDAADALQCDEDFDGAAAENPQEETAQNAPEAPEIRDVPAPREVGGARDTAGAEVASEESAETPDEYSPSPEQHQDPDLGVAQDVSDGAESVQPEPQTGSAESVNGAEEHPQIDIDDDADASKNAAETPDEDKSPDANRQADVEKLFGNVGYAELSAALEKAANEDSAKVGKTPMMSKALGNARTESAAVEKIIAKSAGGKPDSAETVPDDILDGLDFEDETKTADKSAADAAASGVPKSADNSFHLEEMLFSDMPASAPKPDSKNAAVITLHSMSVGIGSQPFIRGSAAPLSPEKGVQMQLVEIGVWRAWIANVNEPLEISVWKNDEEKIGETSYELLPNQKLEISI